MSTNPLAGAPDCCSIPRVEAEYEPKGTYAPYAGFEEAYFTGPEGTGKAIIIAYDIFGFASQTLQGADILGVTVGARVVVPDFFKGNPFPSEKSPPRTDQDRQDLQDFAKTVASFDDRLPELYNVAEALRVDGYGRIGAGGLCWGGKLTTMAGANDLLTAVAAIHPSRLAPTDGDALVAPLGLFPSKSESADVCEKIMEGANTKPFAAKNMYKRYDTVHHGWAGARANLKDPENLKQYKDLYATLSGFFRNTLE